MRALIQKFRRGLARHRGLPAREILFKIWRAGVATGLSHTRLSAFTTVGARARTVGKPLIDNRGTITAGDDLTVNCTVAPVQLVTEPGATLTIGHTVSLGFGVMIGVRESVTLGDRVRVGPYSVIIDTDIPLPGLDAARVASLVRVAPVHIGADVWLGGRVTVLAGSRIGNRSIIAAGSIVSGDIPAGVIAGGAPATVLAALPEP